MRSKFIITLTLLVALANCSGRGQLTTASEPDFKPVSTDLVTNADMEMYSVLSTLKPAPADRIALAVEVQGVDPSLIPAAPDHPLAVYKIGDTRKFWTHDNDALTFTRITAKLMFISRHAYLWQDEQSQPLNATGQVAMQEDWEAAGESFDSSYERVRAVFGQEESPGLDGDERLFVIHSDTLGKVGGYFGQADQLPAEIEAHSNQGQYFFISNTWSSGIASDYYKEVLAHELQHMIHKNVDANEEGWMNEGMSMLAQQVAGMRGYNSVAEYLARPDQSLWYWSGESQDYGQAYLYMDYLYEQMGEQFIKELVADPDNGLDSIDETLVKFNSSRNADAFYADAVTAAYFNDPAMGTGQFTYKIPPLPKITPRYEFTSLPALFQGRVQQYGGFDVITLVGKGKATLTFTGDQRVKLIPADAHSGEHFWWSNRYDSTFSTLTREVDLSSVSKATLNYWTWYDIEEDWDYAYLLVSTDNGTHWDALRATSSRETNPNDQNLGNGFSGFSGGDQNPVWIEETADLSVYTGKHILLRFAMQNDLTVNNFGFAVDDISVPEINWKDDMESDDANWISDGFVRTQNHIPQIWKVRAVEQRADGSSSVYDIDVKNGTGQLNVDFNNTKQLVVFVIGQTRYTSIPASYEIEVK